MDERDVRASAGTMPGQPPGGTPPPGRWGAFSYPNYRRFWVATVARVFGLQFRFIGVGWFVVSRDGLDLSPIWIGIVGLASALPNIVLTVPAGVLTDRYDHRSILLISQVLTALLSLLLAVGILLDAVDIWLLIGWALTVGSLSSLGLPALSAIVPRLIDMRAMPSAVALTSSVWNTMRIIGPAAAGVLIATIGIGQAFFVTAVGMAISAFLIMTLHLDPLEQSGAARRGAMLEGLRYIFGQPVFLATIGLSFFTSVFGMSYHTLLPIFADDILDVGSEGFGFMETAAGCGGFLGTLAMIKIGAGRYAGPTMVGCAALFGLFIAAFATSRDLRLSMALLFCASVASSMYLNIGMTLLQVLVPDELRGRVMGVWSMTWFLSAVGGLPASALAEWIGAPLTVALGALSVSVFAVIVFGVAAELRNLPPVEPTGPVSAPRPA
ncbi:MAG: MFS transporter [Planctomycetota bacterium]